MCVCPQLCVACPLCRAVSCHVSVRESKGVELCRRLNERSKMIVVQRTFHVSSTVLPCSILDTACVVVPFFSAPSMQGERYLPAPFWLRLLLSQSHSWRQDPRAWRMAFMTVAACSTLLSIAVFSVPARKVNNIRAGAYPASIHVWIWSHSLSSAREMSGPRASRVAFLALAAWFQVLSTTVSQSPVWKVNEACKRAATLFRRFAFACHSDALDIFHGPCVPSPAHRSTSKTHASEP